MMARWHGCHKRDPGVTDFLLDGATRDTRDTHISSYARDRPNVPEKTRTGGVYDRGPGGTGILRPFLVRESAQKPVPPGFTCHPTCPDRPLRDGSYDDSGRVFPGLRSPLPPPGRHVPAVAHNDPHPAHPVADLRDLQGGLVQAAIRSVEDGQ